MIIHIISGEINLRKNRRILMTEKKGMNIIVADANDKHHNFSFLSLSGDRFETDNYFTTSPADGQCHTTSRLPSLL